MDVMVDTLVSHSSRTKRPLKVVSVLDYHLPFAGPGRLIVLDDSEDVAGVLRLVSSVAGRREHTFGLDDIFCLRHSELWQVAIPNPFFPERFSLPYWLRNQGAVIMGDDIRQYIPSIHKPATLLRTHLQMTLFLTRSHLILPCLATGRYEELRRRLHHERQLLMTTALLGREIWHVYPHTAIHQFNDEFHNSEITDILAELESIVLSPETCLANEQIALRTVWYHEHFVQLLRSYAE